MLDWYHLAEIQAQRTDPLSYEPGGFSRRTNALDAFFETHDQTSVYARHHLLRSTWVYRTFGRPRAEKSPFFYDLPRGFGSWQGRRWLILLTWASAVDIQGTLLWCLRDARRLE